MSEVSSQAYDESQTSQQREQREPRDDEAALERVVGDLVAVGSVWASHGLKVGKLALQTSASTLQATASVLGDLSDRFERQVDRRWGA